MGGKASKGEAVSGKAGKRAASASSEDSGSDERPGAQQQPSPGGGKSSSKAASPPKNAKGSGGSSGAKPGRTKGRSRSRSPASKWAHENLHEHNSGDSTDSDDGDSPSSDDTGSDSDSLEVPKPPEPKSRRGTKLSKLGVPVIAQPVPEEADTIPLDLKPGDIEVGEFLGDGVYSEVFKGAVYGTPVAVKKFKNQGFDPNVLKEVRKEVRIMRSIRHPNLLLFLGACTEPGQLMIVTELLFCSFHELIGKGITMFQKIAMAKEAAKGLSWLHSLTPVIIHRDLKPENILVSENYASVKVADFGLSLVRDNSSAMVEEMKKIRGSPAFMSPEALLAKTLTPATDVYSFGMILWELFTEGSPYDDLRIESFDQLIDEICEKHTRETIPDTLEPALRQVIRQSWSPVPEDRPSFLDVIALLDTAVLEHAIPDTNGRRMWERCFRQDNQGTMVEVPYTKFQAALEYHVDVGVSNKLWAALRGMLNVKNIGGNKGEPGPVHITDFGNMLKWFGPMEAPNTNKPENSFLARMQRLFTFRWFHGDISTEMAETRLSECEPGTFLVRFSSNPGQWALSKVIQVGEDPEPKTLHLRIQMVDGKYSLTLGDQHYTFDNLMDLVKAEVLELGSPCPGSKYYAQFRVKQSHLGYVN